MTFLESIKPVLEEIKGRNDKQQEFIKKAQTQIKSIQTRLKATLTQQESLSFDTIFDQITNQATKNQDELDNYYSLLQNFLDKISSPDHELEDSSLPEAKKELQSSLTDIEVLIDSFQGLKTMLDSAKLMIRKKQQTPQLKQQQRNQSDDYHSTQQSDSQISNKNNIHSQTPTLHRIQFNNSGNNKTGKINQNVSKQQQNEENMHQHTKQQGVQRFNDQQIPQQQILPRQKPVQTSANAQKTQNNQELQQSFKERRTMLDLERELADVKKQLADERYINHKCAKEIEEMQVEINMSTISKSQELERSLHEKSNAEKYAQQLKEENETLRQQLIDVEITINNVLNSCQSAIQKVETYETQLSEKNYIIEQQNATIKLLQEKLDKQEEQLRQSKELQNKSQGELEVLKEKFIQQQLQQTHSRRTYHNPQSELEDPNDGQAVCKTPQIKKSVKSYNTPLHNTNVGQMQQYQQHIQYVQPYIQQQQYQQIQMPIQNGIIQQSNDPYAFQYHPGQQQQIHEIQQLQDKKNKLASIITQLKGCIDTIVSK